MHVNTNTTKSNKKKTRLAHNVHCTQKNVNSFLIHFLRFTLYLFFKVNPTINMVGLIKMKNIHQNELGYFMRGSKCNIELYITS